MARRARAVIDTSTVIGYVRCSTAEQADSGLGLAAQRAAIRDACERRGWRLVRIHEDAGYSGKNTDRPGLMAALDAVRTGAAGGIVVSKLDRLSRSLADFAYLMAEARAGGWNVVALDLGVDLSTPSGEFLASVLASAAQWERRIIGQRTKDALAAKKAAGVRLGRPKVIDSAVSERIVALVHAGKGWSSVARMLNDESVPTAHGGSRWHPSTVRAAYLSATATAEAAEAG